MSNASTYFSKSACAAVLAVSLAGAQTPPCGRGPLKTGGSTAELRFFPASVEHVRASVLRALPALAARLTKEKDGIIEAKLDTSLSGSSSTIEAQSGGTFQITVTPTKYGGVTGALLSIDFVKGWVGAWVSTDKYATPLADEVACLVGLLSPVDPATNPRGQTSMPPASAREVPVAAKTGLKIALRNYISSKVIEKGVTKVTLTSGQPVFEVIEDVTVDGAVVFRKGALAKGKLIGITAATSGEHGASIQLAIDSATAVDGQEIAVEGGSMKEQGGISRAVASGQIGGLVGLALKGQEALIPSGTTFQVQVANPVTVKGEPEPPKPAASQVAAVNSAPAPRLNLEGTWSSSWGEFKLFQAPGEREFIGRGGGYDIDGVVNEKGVVLHLTSGGELEYSVDLAPKGDDNTLSGQYLPGQVRANTKPKSFEMSKVLNVAAGKNDPPPALNVDGTWNSPDWGKIQLTQAPGQREVSGKRRSYQIDGYVSGTRVVLHFTSGGTVYYSVELTPKGDTTLSGRYATGQMLGNSQTKPFEMTRQK